MIVVRGVLALIGAGVVALLMASYAEARGVDERVAENFFYGVTALLWILVALA